MSFGSSGGEKACKTGGALTLQLLWQVQHKALWLPEGRAEVQQ
jgi:hypothetical protein